MKTLTASYQMPMASRSSEMREAEDCRMRLALRFTHPRELAEAVYFQLGTSTHAGIAKASEGLSLDQALSFVRASNEAWLAELDGPVIETQKRQLSTLHDDAERIIRNWFRFCHPTSPEQLDIFKPYGLPRVEQTCVRDDAGHVVWGTIDAIYEAPGLPTLIADWKTGTRKISDPDTLQLQVYRYITGKPDALAVYVHLDRQQARAVIQDAAPYPGDSWVVRKAQFTEMVKQGIIDTGKAYARKQRGCGTCVAAPVCPVAQDTQAVWADVTKKLRLLTAVPVPLNIAQSLAS